MVGVHRDRVASFSPCPRMDFVVGGRFCSLLSGGPALGVAGGHPPAIHRVASRELLLGTTLVGWAGVLFPPLGRPARAECWGRWRQARLLGDAGGSSPCNQHSRTVPPSPLRGTPPCGGRDKTDQSPEPAVLFPPLGRPARAECWGRWIRPPGRRRRGQWATGLRRGIGGCRGVSPLQSTGTPRRRIAR